MSHVIHSQLIAADYTKDYPMVTHGKGIYLYDDKGKEYIDASGCTAVVTNIGHGVEEVANVLKEQATKLAVHPTHVFYNKELESYLKNLCDFAPEGFNHAWTICGGTEAIENSIKLAFQYHRSKNQKRTKILGRWGSYHGNSILALDIGGNKVRRDYYTDLMVEHLHVSPAFPYRMPSDMTIEQYEDQLIAEFEQTVKENPNDIICFVAEPIVGAAIGAVSPPKNYFKRIKEICEREDILFIADEVMTGFGRTGTAFGMDHFGVTADIMACAKGISSGYFPLGAVIAHDKVIKPIEESGKPFFSGQTYSCIPLAAAVGDAVLNYLRDNNLVENSKEVGNYLKEKLYTLEKFATVGDVRGEGLFLSIEFVKDKNTKEAIDPDFFFAKKVETAALELGLITYACRGTVDLVKGDHLLLAPPLTLTKAEADLIFERLEKAIEKITNEWGN
jgi:adenosylmethionine-8-amino-7-oxononanoate aminotransferase